jgi:hypothetical protein
MNSHLDTWHKKRHMVQAFSPAGRLGSRAGKTDGHRQQQQDRSRRRDMYLSAASGIESQVGRAHLVVLEDALSGTYA